MAYELRDNRFSMFKNSRKQRDSQPDLDGRGRVVCPHCNAAQDFWINGWNEESQDGKTKYISISVRPMEEQAPSPVAPASPPPAADDFSDDIPF